MAQRIVEEKSFDELYREIERLPKGVTGEILTPGVIRTMGRPGRHHRFSAKKLTKFLAAFDRDVGGTGWWIEIEAEVRLLRNRLLVPDLSGWRVERLPDGPKQNPITIVPDWVCEILSPSTAKDDRKLKLPIYARAGVQWIWLVDSDIGLIEVFETKGELPTLVESASDEEKKALPPFGDFAVLSLWLPKEEEAAPTE